MDAMSWAARALTFVKVVVVLFLTLYGVMLILTQLTSLISGVIVAGILTAATAPGLLALCALGGTSLKRRLLSLVVALSINSALAALWVQSQIGTGAWTQR